MSGKEHLLFGITTTSVFTFCFLENEPATTTACLIAGASLGSLFPDIDHPKSLIGRFFPFLSRTLYLSGHRETTHDLFWWTIILALLAYKFPILSGFSYGYVGHLIMDSFTAEGVPFCRPFYKKNVHALPYCMKFYSGGIASHFVTVLITAGISALIYYAKQILL